jgi:GNAT superfamily N-acetyltransferase
MMVSRWRRLSSSCRQGRNSCGSDRRAARSEPLALRHLIDSVDGVDHVAFAAFDDSGRLVGVARILRYPHDPDTLDVGMAVADDYQGAGLGHVLGYLLAAHRPRPAKRILTAVASDNKRVMSLLRAFGATPIWSGTGIVIELPD